MKNSISSTELVCPCGTSIQQQAHSPFVIGKTTTCYSCRQTIQSVFKNSTLALVCLKDIWHVSSNGWAGHTARIVVSPSGETHPFDEMPDNARRELLSHGLIFER